MIPTEQMIEAGARALMAYLDTGRHIHTALHGEVIDHWKEQANATLTAALADLPEPQPEGVVILDGQRYEVEPVEHHCATEQFASETFRCPADKADFAALLPPRPCGANKGERMKPTEQTSTP